MVKNYGGTRRGWTFDPITDSLDLVVGGTIVRKFAASGKGLYNIDTTKKYKLGTSLQTPDGRVFYYGEAGTSGVNAGWGAFFEITQTMAYEAIHVAAVAGQNTVVINQASIAKDEWAGGYIILGHNSAATEQNRYILSNTATNSDTHVVVTLDGPLSVALSTSEGVEIIPNPYSNLQTKASQEYCGVAGVSAVTATTGQFCWFQTWGPLWVTPGGAGTPGSTACERTVYFQGDGAIVGDVGFADPTTEPERRQVAGFIIQKDSAGAGGPPFIMLQIRP